MEQFVTLIVIFIIFVLGRILESAQKKANQSQTVSRRSSAKKRPDYVQPATDSVSHKEPVGSTKRDEVYNYKAPQTEVEDFLRDIGILAPKPVSEPQKPVAQPSKSVAVKKKTKDQSKVTAKAQPLESMFEPQQKLDWFKHIKSSGENSGGQHQQEDCIAGETNLAVLLHDKNMLRTAFVMNELLQPPIVLRGRRANRK